MISDRAVRIDREDAIKRAVTFVVKNYAGVIRPRDLETASGAPRETMDSYFREIYGVAPMQWVWMFRTVMAAEIMAQAPQFTLEEVAHAAGFHDMDHFNRCFLNLIGSVADEFKAQAATLIQVESMGRRKVFRLQSLAAAQNASIGCALEKILSSLKLAKELGNTLTYN